MAKEYLDKAGLTYLWGKLKDVFAKKADFDNVGTTYSNDKSINIASTNVDTYVSGASVTVPAGTYIIVASASFTSSATAAIRRVAIYNDTDSANVQIESYWGQYWVAHQAVSIQTFTKSTKLVARISAGVALSNNSTQIQAIRIK